MTATGDAQLLDRDEIRRLFDLRNSFMALSGGGYTDDPYVHWNALREQAPVHEGVLHDISGYPGDKPDGTQWYAARRIASVAARKVYYDIDTFGGQSGSAVYRIVDGKRYAFAIHAYGAAGGLLHVHAVLDEDRLEVAIRDDGRWRPPLDDRGQGLRIIGQLADTMDVDTDDSGTMVTFTRQLAPAQPN